MVSSPPTLFPNPYRRGLEMAYEDWCISQIAKKAGNMELANEYAKKPNTTNAI